MALGRLNRSRYQSPPNLTPLADVAVVLLIFLMLAGSFGTSEHFIVSSAPIHAMICCHPLPSWTPPANLEVHVSADGDASILGLLDHEPNPERVKTALEIKLWRLRMANAADPDSAPAVAVILCPEPGTKWGQLAPFSAAAIRAEAPSVSFGEARPLVPRQIP